MVQITLRNAKLDDRYRLFRWRNDPSIYSKGFSGKPVMWDDHILWFNSVIYSEMHDIFIIEKDKMAIGQIRFSQSQNSDKAEVSIYLTKNNTGKGYGVDAIKLGCDRIKKIAPWLKIYADFLPENIYSKRAFIKAGFVNAGKNRMKLRV